MKYIALAAATVALVSAQDGYASTKQTLTTTSTLTSTYTSTCTVKYATVTVTAGTTAPTAPAGGYVASSGLAAPYPTGPSGLNSTRPSPTAQPYTGAASSSSPQAIVAAVAGIMALVAFY